MCDVINIGKFQLVFHADKVVVLVNNRPLTQFKAAGKKEGLIRFSDWLDNEIEIKMENINMFMELGRSVRQILIKEFK